MKPPGAKAWAGGAFLAYTAAFLIYSQTRAFTWDAIYHLLAAQLINAGKTPYIDFFFPQTPLNAYWNAGWMRLAGENWRVPQALAALFTLGAVTLTADFVYRRFPVPGWRLPAASAAGLFTGLNFLVFAYGPVGQAYGVCLFCLMAGFRLAVRAVERRGAPLAAAAGLCAGAAASSSLLTAAAIPVLLAWMLVSNREGSRWTKCAVFAGGVLVPFAPVFRLFWQGPRQTWFNLAGYHIHFRRLCWPDTTPHDIEVLISPIDDCQALLLGVLAVSGLLYLVYRSAWPRALKAEFYLCAWLAAALCAEAGVTHPTFSRYFVLAIPFLAIPAAAGLYALASRVLAPDRSWWPVLLCLALYGLGFGKAMYDGRGDYDWSRYERLAKVVDRVAPPGEPLFADEAIYFLTRRRAPSGYEVENARAADLPPAEAAYLRVIPEAEARRQIQSGMFAAAFTCEEEDQYGLARLYKRHMETEGCSIYWDRK